MQNMTFTSLHSNLNNKSESEKGKRFSRSNIIAFFTSLRFFALLIVAFQIIIILLLVNPINIANQLTAVQVINKVSQVAVVPPSEVPVFGAIGDNKVLPDIDTLKKDNAIQQQVYKDAKNGDYVLGYTTKMIIYRESENKVIYEGDSPAVLLQKSQESLANAIQAKAKEAGIIDSNETEIPTYTIITDVNEFKSSNSDFYAQAQVNDAVVLFQNSKKIILYRPDTNSILKYSDYAFSIK